MLERLEVETCKVRLNFSILRSTYSGQPSDLAALSAGCIIVHLPTFLVFKPTPSQASSQLLSHPHYDDPSLFTAKKHIIIFFR